MAPSIIQLVSVILILDISPGTSQGDVLFFYNESDSRICKGTVIRYTCVAASIAIEWSVEFESNTVDILLQNTFDLSVVNISDNIVVNLIQTVPYIATTLTITAFDSGIVKCMSADRSSSTSSIDILLNESNMSAPGAPCEMYDIANFQQGILNIEYEAAEGTDVVNYIVNCTDDRCDQVIVEGTFASLRAKSRYPGNCFDICVYPIDRCENVGPSNCSNVCFETGKDLVATTSLTVIFGVIAVAGVIVLLFTNLYAFLELRSMKKNLKQDGKKELGTSTAEQKL